MNNITYYIGAGASINALPLYKSFQERLKIFKCFIFEYQRNREPAFQGKAKLYMQKLEILINDLDSTYTSTLDSLAHELYRKREYGSDKLTFFQLKYLINDFFVFEQLQNKPLFKAVENNPDFTVLKGWFTEDVLQKVGVSIDRRYKDFINTEQKAGDKFPGNINIISWNYDMQFELALSQVTGFSVDFCQQNMQVFPTPDTQRGINLNSSAIIKLNGTAGIYFPDNSSQRIDIFPKGSKFQYESWFLESLIEVFYTNQGRIFNGYPLFKFYFEDQNQLHLKAAEYANEIIKKTETLIVIGYSFHPCNREIDKKVFDGAMNIKNVIVQVPDNDSYDIISYQFSKVIPTNAYKISHHRFCNNFFEISNI